MKASVSLTQSLLLAGLHQAEDDCSQSISTQREFPGGAPLSMTGPLLPAAAYEVCADPSLLLAHPFDKDVTPKFQNEAMVSQDVAGALWDLNPSTHPSAVHAAG